MVQNLVEYPDLVKAVLQNHEGVESSIKCRALVPLNSLIIDICPHFNQWCTTSAPPKPGAAVQRAQVASNELKLLCRRSSSRALRDPKPVALSSAVEPKEFESRGHLARRRIWMASVLFTPCCTVKRSVNHRPAGDLAFGRDQQLDSFIVLEAAGNTKR